MKDRMILLLLTQCERLAAPVPAPEHHEAAADSHRGAEVALLGQGRGLHPGVGAGGIGPALTWLDLILTHSINRVMKLPPPPHLIVLLSVIVASTGQHCSPHPG